MHPIAYVIMTFGAALALTGIVLFAKKGSQGSNTIKMLGFEFQLAGSSLVIFVMGTIMFLFPILYSDRLPAPRQRYPGAKVPAPPRSAMPQRSSTLKPSTDPHKDAKASIAETLRMHREAVAKGDYVGADLALVEYRLTLEAELEVLGFAASKLKNMTQREITELARREGLIE